MRYSIDANHTMLVIVLDLHMLVAPAVPGRRYCLGHSAAILFVGSVVPGYEHRMVLGVVGSAETHRHLVVHVFQPAELFDDRTVPVVAIRLAHGHANMLGGRRGIQCPRRGSVPPMLDWL